MTANEQIFSRIRQFVVVACLAAAGSVAAWAAQVDQATPPQLPALVVPGYGPGIAGHILEGPVTPVCRLNIPCVRPFANATVLIVDRTTRDTVGEAVTNASGSFLVTVPPGAYLVHVEVVNFPRCPEVQATVGQINFTLVQITCNTGIV